LTRVFASLCTAEVGVNCGVTAAIRLEELGRPPVEVEVKRPVGAIGEDCAALTRILVKNGS
jgi:hypothetical protein